MHGANRSKTMRRGLSILIAGIAVGANLVGASRAEDEEKAKKSASIWQQETLTGDWGGARTALHDKGFDLSLIYFGDLFGALSGGLHRDASYEHRFEFSVDTDLQKLVGWKGATTHFTIYQIADGGRNTAENVGALFDPSDIDAVPTTRLFTAWYEQSFNDRIWLRVGQLAADDEFIIAPTAGGLLNGTFGWASILSANMINGGPAYPLATPGARLLAGLTDNLSLLGAVLSGDPAGANCNDDPQICNRYGTTFSFSGGALGIGELRYAINQGKDAIGLPGVYRLGVWYATAEFSDQHVGLDGAGKVVSLADPTVAGPLNHRGDWGIYAVADQAVWRAGSRKLSLFLRGGISPTDRNLLSHYVDGGVGIQGLLASRPDDVLTFGVAYARVGHDAAAFDQDTRIISDPLYPSRDYELAFELSYQWQIAPWWTVQPDLQYIVHPGGNVADPDDPASTVRNAFIAGIRTAIKF